jgi:hypothetical protein
MNVPVEILIVVGVAAVVAIAIKLVRAGTTRRRQPTHVHDALMKRAEAHAAESPFLTKVCREYKANGHISDRQANAVIKAITRLEKVRSSTTRR